MSPDAPAKDRAVYHQILAEMHRIRSIMLNLTTLDDPGAETGIREHLTREQNLALGRLNEWRLRRPQIYKQAQDDFQRFSQ